MRALVVVLGTCALLGLVPLIPPALARADDPPVATTLPDPLWDRPVELIGSNDDMTQAVALMPDGGALIAGNTINGTFGGGSYVAFGDAAVVVRVSASGQKVTSWGDGGVARLDTQRNLRVNGVAVDPYGRAYLYGYDRFEIWDAYDSLVVRLRADGTPDPTFGTNGIRTYDVGTDDRVYAMTFDSYARPILNIYESNSHFSALVRLAEDGDPDPGFGNQYGFALVELPGEPLRETIVKDMAVDGAGRITVATERNGMVRRYTPDGKPDLTYGPGGIRYLPNGDGHFYSPAVRADGSVVATYWAWGWDGHESGTTVLVGLTSTGAVDPLYGADGRELQVPPTQVARVIDAVPGGGVLLSDPRGTYPEMLGYALVRVLATGAPDPTFGTAGEIAPDPTFVTAALGRNGRIWVGETVASSSTKRDLRLVALRATGAVDSAFGTQGHVDHGVEELHGASHYTTVVDRQGRTLELAVAGGIFWLVRLASNGSLDSSFAANGKLRLPPDVGPYASYAVRDDGSVLVITRDRVLHDYAADGTPSHRLAGTSTGVLPRLRNDELWFPGLHADALPDGSVLVTGTSQDWTASCNTSWVEKIGPDGNRVDTFGVHGRIDLDDCAIGPANVAVDRTAGTFTLAHRTYTSPAGTNEVILSRRHLDGTPDIGFGVLGQVREPAALRVIQSFGQDEQGRIVLLTHNTPYDPAAVEVRRYTPQGAVDPTYGTAGTITLLPAGTSSSIAVAPDGAAVVLSRTTATVADPNVVSVARVQRILPDGSFDPAWGGASGVDPGSGAYWSTVTQAGDGFVLTTNTSAPEVRLRHFASTGPTALWVVPSAGKVEGGDTVVVNGLGFTPQTTVSFGGAPATVVELVSSRELRVVTPPRDPGPVNVTVSDGSPGSGHDLGVTFTYRLPGMIAVAPTRLLDTRPASRVGAVQPKPGPSGVVRVKVAGVAGVPASGAEAVSLSLTGTEAEGDTYVTAWPCDAPRPTASNLNLSSTDSTAANLVLVAPSASGEVCLFASARTHLLVDVLGWIPSYTGFTPTTPRRLLDTRVTGKQVLGPLLKIDVGSGDPGTVVLNVTATGSTAPGWVTVVPCGQTSDTSSLNVDRVGQTVANLVVTALSYADEVCLFTSHPVDLVVDLAGWWTDDALYPLTPVRVQDTRASGTPPVANRVVRAFVGGASGVPVSGISAVFLNVTATGGSTTGFLTVWPCDEPRPWASNLNISRPGQTVAVLAATALDDEGSACVYTSAATDVIVDVTAWLP